MYKSLFLVFWCIVHIWIFTISSSTYHSGFFYRSYISLIMWLVMWPFGVGLKSGLLCKWFSLKKSIALETSHRFLDMLNKCTYGEQKCDSFWVQHLFYECARLLCFLHRVAVAAQPKILNFILTTEESDRAPSNTPFTFYQRKPIGPPKCCRSKKAAADSLVIISFYIGEETNQCFFSRSN